MKFLSLVSNFLIHLFQFLLNPIKPDLCLFGTNLSGITVSLELLNLLQQPVLLRLQIGNHGLKGLEPGSGMFDVFLQATQSSALLPDDSLLPLDGLR